MKDAMLCIEPGQIPQITYLVNRVKHYIYQHLVMGKLKQNDSYG